jgi:hypothetical protein
MTRATNQWGRFCLRQADHKRLSDNFKFNKILGIAEVFRLCSVNNTWKGTSYIIDLWVNFTLDSQSMHSCEERIWNGEGWAVIRPWIARSCPQYLFYTSLNPRGVKPPTEKRRKSHHQLYIVKCSLSHNKQHYCVLTGNLVECLGFMSRQERAYTLLTAEGVHKTGRSCLPSGSKRNAWNIKQLTGVFSVIFHSSLLLMFAHCR